MDHPRVLTPPASRRRSPHAPRTIPCLGASVPAGYSPRGYDVNDGDPSITSDPSSDELARLLD